MGGNVYFSSIFDPIFAQHLHPTIKNCCKIVNNGKLKNRYKITYKNNKIKQEPVKNPFLKYCLLILLLLMILPNSSLGYQYDVGVEAGDVIDIDYVGTFTNGTEFDSGNIPDAKVELGQFIDGFYFGLLGMKLNQKKTINVSPDQAYTDPSHRLYGERLIFVVTLKKIVTNIRGTDAEINPPPAKEGGGPATKLWNVLKWILGIGVGVVLSFSIYSIFQKQTTPGCSHCKSLGRSKISEGKCGKCGTPYCRNSFSRGCPNCKSNTFIPYS